MTRSSRYTPECPEVAVILNGIWKSGIKTYYRIDADGKHIDVRIREELMAALGISSKLASRLLQQANLPCAPFICIRAAVKARAITSDNVSSPTTPVDDMEIEPEDEVEADGDMGDELEECPVTGHSQSIASSGQSKQEMARAQRAAKAAIAHCKRYELVKQGSYTGIYNKDSATTELFHTEAEALAYLDELIHGREAFRIYHGSPPS